MLIAAPSPLTVALLSAIAALMAAVLAPLLNWTSVMSSNRHARRMRVRDDKARAYVQTIRHSRRQIYILGQARRFLEKLEKGATRAESNLKLPKQDLEEFLDDAAAIRAFGSTQVREALDAFDELALEAFTKMNDIDQTLHEDRVEYLAYLVPTLVELRKRLDTMSTRVRDELTD